MLLTTFLRGEPCLQLTRMQLRVVNIRSRCNKVTSEIGTRSTSSHFLDQLASTRHPQASTDAAWIHNFSPTSKSPALQDTRDPTTSVSIPEHTLHPRSLLMCLTYSTLYSWFLLFLFSLSPFFGFLVILAFLSVGLSIHIMFSSSNFASSCNPLRYLDA